MIPIQILRVLSTIQQFDARALLMGGQACVLYGAAEYSRDLDLAVVADGAELPRLGDALRSLRATTIAVPPFEAHYLARGHGVHFSIPDDNGDSLRVDIMSRMRGVAPFADLWERRTTVMLPDSESDHELAVEMMSLEDLVTAKKTQRDKDWPMIRRLVDASYVSSRDTTPTDDQIMFWLAELRTPEFLHEVVSAFPRHAWRSTRKAVSAATAGAGVGECLAVEQREEMELDRLYWQPLRKELETLRHAARKG